jgi:hypothetical protein
MRVLLTLPEPPGSTGIRPMKETLLTQEGQSMPRPEHPSAVEHRYIGAPVARMFPTFAIPGDAGSRGWNRSRHTDRHAGPFQDQHGPALRTSNAGAPNQGHGQDGAIRRGAEDCFRRACKRLPKRSNELRGTGKVRYSLQFPLHRAFHRNRETSKSLRVWRRG